MDTYSYEKLAIEMKNGRPKTLRPVKHRRAYFEASRREERLELLHKKKQKLEMLESILLMHTQSNKPDDNDIRDVKRRANETRQQLAVMSTTELMERV